MTEVVVKRKGQSAEHMAKIRAMRKPKEEAAQVGPLHAIIDLSDSEVLPTEQAFMIEEVDAVGGKLYQCVMLTVQGERILARTPLTHADSKAATLNQLRLKAFQFYFEERLPEKRSEGVEASV